MTRDVIHYRNATRFGLKRQVTVSDEERAKLLPGEQHPGEHAYLCWCGVWHWNEGFGPTTKGEK